MKLEIKYVKDRGTDKERIVLVAQEDCDIGRFFVFTSVMIGEKISPAVRHPFWLPDQRVKKGDLVVIYTKQGESSLKQNESNKTYFYYRGFASPILTNGNIALIVEASTYKWEGQ